MHLADPLQCDVAWFDVLCWAEAGAVTYFYFRMRWDTLTTMLSPHHQVIRERGVTLWQLDTLYQIALKEFKWLKLYCVLMHFDMKSLSVGGCVGICWQQSNFIRMHADRHKTVMIAYFSSRIKPFLHICHSSVYCVHTCAHEIFLHNFH